MDEEIEAFLSHHGIRGQRWGVRHDPNLNGVSRSTSRLAKKDAHEFARAKLFYGEGAGNRRKLINATVDARKKRDPSYAKAFDSHLTNQDLSTHASKARKERSSIDRKDKNKKRAGAIARRLTGEWGTQAAFVALAASGAAFANSPKGRQFLNNSVSKIKNTRADFVRKQGAKHISDILKNMK